jgi:NTP pyrophosphatase (non-canonical NTP hydrolase)
MVHSEVSEVLEAIRKEQGGDKIVEEFADILIRVLDLYWGMKMDGAIETEEGSPSLHDVFEKKISINLDRPRMHGVLA